MEPVDSNTQQQDGRRVVNSGLSCPVCGDEHITTKWTSHEFEYGSRKSPVQLQVRVPVHRCGECGFEYLDDEAERLKHIAICEHLGVLRPDEIRGIRKDYGMTQAAFAQLTGLGEASLNRWENGLSIQTHAYDRYLRLLASPEIMWKLQAFEAARPSGTGSTANAGDRFRVVEVTDGLRKDQEAFQLRPAA